MLKSAMLPWAVGLALAGPTSADPTDPPEPPYPIIRLTDTDAYESLQVSDANTALWLEDQKIWASGGNRALPILHDGVPKENLALFGSKIAYVIPRNFPEDDSLMVWDRFTSQEIFLGSPGITSVAPPYLAFIHRDVSTQPDDVFRWDGTTVERVTNDLDVDARAIVAPSGQMLWGWSPFVSSGLPSLKHWDGTTVSTFVETDRIGFDFDYDGSRAVWEHEDPVTGDTSIRYWDGTTTFDLDTGTLAGSGTRNPRLFGGGAVWSRGASPTDEIYWWDGTQTHQISDANGDDSFRDARNGRVAYRRDQEVYVWEAGVATRITYDDDPVGRVLLTDDAVFWEGVPPDGSDREIFVVRFASWSVVACEDGLDDDGDGLIDYPEDPGCPHPRSDREDPPCDDGLDNDNDGAIDWDGSPADPECSTPWSGEGKACALGPELAAVLPLLWLGRARRRATRARGSTRG